MTANENRPESIEAAPKVLADYPQDTESHRLSPATTRATIRDVLNGARHPHELGDDRHDLYRLGFRDGCNRMQETVYDLQRQVSYWYFVANNPGDAVAERQALLKSFDIVTARRTMDEQWAELDRIATERAEAAR